LNGEFFSAPIILITANDKGLNTGFGIYLPSAFKSAMWANASHRTPHQRNGFGVFFFLFALGSLLRCFFGFLLGFLPCSLLFFRRFLSGLFNFLRVCRDADLRAAVRAVCVEIF
jgi:hypothetical protein